MARARRKFAVFAIGAASLSALLGVAAVLGVDLFLHWRSERSAGLNRWGYRGPVVGRKQPGETRVAMIGGSTTFGYGVTWDEAVPALLERELNAGGGRWSVVNLGYNNEGAFALVPNIEDFAYLDFDAAIFYLGYNDLAGDEGPNRTAYRRSSPVFRLTGYFPLLPLWLEEKALSIRHGGDLNAAYDASRGVIGRNVFRPGLAARASASALEAAAHVGASIGRQLESAAGPAHAARAVTAAGDCAPPWVHYCDDVARAVELALGRGQAVVVAEQPAITGEVSEARHASQRQALGAMVAARFGGNPRVRHADLSALVDVRDPDLSFDRMHLGVAGNRIVARALVEPVTAVAAAPGPSPP